MALFPCNIGSSGGTGSFTNLIATSGGSYTFTDNYDVLEWEIVAIRSSTPSVTLNVNLSSGTYTTIFDEVVSGSQPVYARVMHIILNNVKAGDTIGFSTNYTGTSYLFE